MNARPEAVTVRCAGCGETFGMVWLAEGGDPTWQGDWTAARASRGSMVTGTAGPACVNGRIDFAGDDWNTIECLKCHRVWQGRDGYLHDLASGAAGGVVSLGQAVLPASASGFDEAR